VTNVTSSILIMKIERLDTIVGNTDIYVLDQILKERYSKTDIILDAGCGKGRNLYWFDYHDFKIWGVDQDIESVNYVKEKYPKVASKIVLSQLQNLPFDSSFFDHIICCAVLHFSESTDTFKKMFSSLMRVLKPNGTLFIRMTSNIGIEKYVTPIKNGIYQLGDQSERFLLTKELLQEMMKIHKLSFLEPIKSTNVSDQRCMTTLVLQKNFM